MTHQQNSTRNRLRSTLRDLKTNSPKIRSFLLAALILLPATLQLSSITHGGVPSLVNSNNSVLTAGILSSIILITLATESRVLIFLRILIIAAIFQAHHAIINQQLNLYIFVWVACVTIVLVTFNLLLSKPFDGTLLIWCLNIIFIILFAIMMSWAKDYKYNSFVNQNQLTGWVVTVYIINLILFFDKKYVKYVPVRYIVFSIITGVIGSWLSLHYETRAAALILLISIPISTFHLFPFQSHKFRLVFFIIISLTVTILYSLFIADLSRDSGRIGIWKIAMEQSTLNELRLLFGHGMNSFPDYFKKTGMHFSGHHFWFQSFHNIFLTILFNFGIIGLISTIIYVLAALNKALIKATKSTLIGTMFLLVNVSLTGNYIHAWFFIPGIFIFCYVRKRNNI